MRLPKRGFHNHAAADDAQVVNVKALARFAKGAVVDAAALAEAGLIRSATKPVKLLGDGALENAITVEGQPGLCVGARQGGSGRRERGARAGMNSGAIGNITRIPELNRRILFTFAMLAVYRLGCAVPTPGIDPTEIRHYFDQSGDGGGMFGLLNLFTGGAFEQLSVFSLGIMPYVSSSIILQLLAVVIPKLDELRKEGEEGRRVITRYTRYGTVVLAVVQGFLMATALENGALGRQHRHEPGLDVPDHHDHDPDRGHRRSSCGSASRSTSAGSATASRSSSSPASSRAFPPALSRVWDMMRTDQISPLAFLLLVGFMVGVVGVIVYFERAQRRIPIQYARRVVGRRQLAGGMTYFPLRLNTSGVIPPIFASSLLVLPAAVRAVERLRVGSPTSSTTTWAGTPGATTCSTWR